MPGSAEAWPASGGRDGRREEGREEEKERVRRRVQVGYRKREKGCRGEGRRGGREGRTAYLG